MPCLDAVSHDEFSYSLLILACNWALQCCVTALQSLCKGGGQGMGTPRGASPTSCFLYILCLTSPFSEILLHTGTTCTKDRVSGYTNRYHRHCDSFHFRWEPAEGTYSVRFSPSAVKLSTYHPMAPWLWWSCHSQPLEGATSREQSLWKALPCQQPGLCVHPVFAHSDVLWLKSLPRWSSVNPKGKGSGHTS